MKLMLPLMFLFAAVPAFASAPHCPPGQLNVWGACVDPVGPGVFDRDYGYEMERGHGYRHHRGHRHQRGRHHHGHHCDGHHHHGHGYGHHGWH